MGRKRSGHVVPRQYFCTVLCVTLLASVILFLTLLDLSYGSEPAPKSFIRAGKVGPHLAEEWIPVLSKGNIETVNFFHKGLALKYEVVFETGHVASAKPILPESWFGGDPYRTVDYDDLISRQQRILRRAEWEFQGFSEIASYHLDKVLGFHKKPPIVGRNIPSRLLYANDDTWTGLLHRWLPSHDVPMALVPWVDGLQRGIPDLSIRDYLTGNGTKKLTAHKKKQAADVSDKLVLDYLLDDHDTQGTQNWKADISGQLLHWDSGLGWRDGPYPKTSCYDILCGTKQWKGVGHHDANPDECNRVCRFREGTMDLVRELRKGKTSKKERLSQLLMESMKADSLYPVFDYGLFRYYKYDSKGDRAGSETVHLKPEVFFYGMETRVKKLVSHFDGCAKEFGEEFITLHD